MMLLTKANLKSLPALYSTEDVPSEDTMIQVKLYDAFGSAYWLIAEYDPETETAFGYAEVLAGCGEWGYVHIPEIKALKFHGALRIERDKHIDLPAKFSRFKGAYLTHAGVPVITG